MSNEDLLNFNAERIDGQIADLLDTLEAHPLMQPPNTNPSIFFLTDFIRNTRRELLAIDVDKLRNGDPAAKHAATEVLGRNSFANLLIDNPDKLAPMTGGDPGEPLVFGEDIKAKMRALLEV